MQNKKIIFKYNTKQRNIFITITIINMILFFVHWYDCANDYPFVNWMFKQLF